MKKGFTMIELVMVIVILGILAAIAIPAYVSLAQDARIAATKGSIGSIRAAVAIQYAQNAIANITPSYPTTISGNMFAEGVVPQNQLAPTGSGVVTAYDGTGGWVYHSSTGTVESNDSAHTAM
jgi:MSHA pilin protein MshA